MRDTKMKITDSILEVKATGCLDIEKDLNTPNGKSIAQLLHEEESEENNISKEED